MTIAQHLGIIQKDISSSHIPSWTEIPRLRREGTDPYKILDCILSTYGPHHRAVQECIRSIGAGSSPWIQISKFLLTVPGPS